MHRFAKSLEHRTLPGASPLPYGLSIFDLERYASQTLDYLRTRTLHRERTVVGGEV